MKEFIARTIYIMLIIGLLHFIKFLFGYENAMLSALGIIIIVLFDLKNGQN